MEDGDGDGDVDGSGGVEGLGVKQFYVTSSLKLQVYWTINQNLQNISLSLSLNFNIIWIFVWMEQRFRLIKCKLQQESYRDILFACTEC